MLTGSQTSFGLKGKRNGLSPLPPSRDDVIDTSHEIVVTDEDDTDDTCSQLSENVSLGVCGGNSNGDVMDRFTAVSPSPTLSARATPEKVTTPSSKTLLNDRKLDARESHKLQMELEGFYSRALPETMVEKSDFQHQALQEMQQAIDTKIIPSDKQAYMQGLALGSYVRRDDLRLRYLRTEVWDALAAAKRFVSHLQMLQDYFGDVALTRDLKFSDLGKEELKFVKKGTVQLLPSRDRAGRRVVCFLGDWGTGFSADANTKCSLYIASVLAEDVISQRDGAVCIIYYPTFHDAMKDKKLNKETTRLWASLPFRYSAMHLCLPKNTLGFFFQSLMFFGKYYQKHLVVHTGTNTEIEYKLQSVYGVNCKEIPITNTGSIKLVQWRQWIKVRKAIDEFRSKENQSLQQRSDGKTAVSSTYLVECPDFNSIVFRKAGIMWNHPPNKIFRTILSSYEEKREEAKTLDEKKQVITDIINDVENLNLRFLVWDEAGWYVPFTDKFLLRESIGQAFRDHIKRNRTISKKVSQGNSNREEIFLQETNTNGVHNCACVGGPSKRTKNK